MGANRRSSGSVAAQALELDLFPLRALRFGLRGLCVKSGSEFSTAKYAKKREGGLVWILQNPRPSVPSGRRFVVELDLWTQSAQRLGSSSPRKASASVTSFELRALCDEKSLDRHPRHSCDPWQTGLDLRPSASSAVEILLFGMPCQKSCPKCAILRHCDSLNPCRSV